MSNDSDLVAAALADAARAIHSPSSLEDTLHSIVHAAQQTVPGFEHVGISVVHRDGRIETKAGTGPLVFDLDALQYELGQGPCVDAIRDDPVMVMERASREERWPDYTPRAAEMGLRSQLGLRLYTEEETLGGLNFYSTECEGIDLEAVEIAELFTTHAAIALGCASEKHQLRESVSTRQAIGTAVGIMMERYQVTEDRAFQYLARASMSSNIKLRMIAQDVVDGANEKFAGRPDQR